MQAFMIFMALFVALSGAATITNNNNASPGQSITNNNSVMDDEDVGLVSSLVKSVMGDKKTEDHPTPKKDQTLRTLPDKSSIKVKLAKQPKVKVDSEAECPYGVQINNNQGKKEIYCLREGVPSVTNNNN